ncbi:tRNA pseudouridine synthase A, mitochondrial isoform X2 [Arabidopsis lyrata subsp. lyrata]|uniref:tRNA pseudouridine synthase A, mitochondrial isoform X2 n=1 Tax=Arabidopsis lyrata subsp. lyrata TaxID=81972 RepID=UPI000A29A377|nr:tRNA pseudouridine synthase A, mitochondrial isoform X2 [Arabidopsis lyrata subsp. lyrata]|eukprot:XP_020890736.1 tRNA pseudouridine synthase A, mitochondrial isoform X2 [Arabidopsis lyrata subsp. lyrata]
MLTTTTDEETDMSCGGGVTEPQKVAIIFAFCGVGYQGMQKNPGAKTIEGELEEALFHAGAVPESIRGKPKLYDFARSARTDKGVSAVGQVVSGRFNVDPPGFVDRLNSNLPNQIRIFGYKHVTPSFSSKKFCDRRRYVYLLPVFALDPISHRDRETVMASLGPGEEYVKCFECSERGRKIPGLVGNWKDVEVGSIQEDSCKLNTNSTEKINGEGNVMAETKSKFCYGEKEKERFNRILSCYVGSYNFHNFTTRTKADDPAANRQIISFTANTVINLDGIDFIKCEVLGKSFMLHQIRKMMGLAVAIMRNCASESLIQTAFSKDVNITVPMAPEVGLYLDECFFTSYNKKFEDSHEEVSMEAYKEEAEAFKLKHIYSHICATERKYGNMALWLHSLNYRNYPDLNFGSHGHNNRVQISCSEES